MTKDRAVQYTMLEFNHIQDALNKAKGEDVWSKAGAENALSYASELAHHAIHLMGELARLVQLSKKRTRKEEA